MRVLLVQPSWSDIHASFSGIARRHACVPPLGIGYLASIARNCGHDVTILDAEVECLDDDATAAAILDIGPDVVGFSATTPIYHKAVNVAQRVKEQSPNTFTVVGGPHISLLGEEVFFPCFDTAIRGEADAVFPEFLEKIEFGSQDFRDVPGVLFREGTQVVDGGWAPVVQELDSLPFPAWDLYDLHAYRIQVKSRGEVPYATLTLTRGCPFRCSFCSANLLEGKKLRCRSPRNVVDEILFLKEDFNIQHICFNDSTLTLRKSLIEEFCSLLIDAQVNITWEGWTRANLIDRELLSRMKEAGFVRISFGIESGRPHILRLIRKEVRHEDMRNAYKLAGELGIEATCSAMMGHPGEVEEDIWETVRFIRSIPEIEFSPLSIAVPYPGSELYEMARKGEHGLKLLTQDYSKYLRYAGGVMEVNGMTPEYLSKLQKRALIWMHLTPRKILGVLRRFGMLSILRAILSRS